MDMTFTVNARIAREVGEVFEAVANPAELSRYFTTGGARGRLESDTTVTWDFHDYPGEFPVYVLEVEEDRRIVMQWDNPDGEPARTTVTFSFEALDGGRTLISITESGWQNSETGLRASYGNCHGWTQMLCALKAYLEHGINLRQGFYT